MRKFISLVFAFMIFLFYGCKKKHIDDFDMEIVIEDVSPLYVSEGGKFALTARSFTNLKSENKIEFNGFSAEYDIIKEGVLSVIIPIGVFNEERFNAEIVFENVCGDRDTACVYYDKYPRVYNFDPIRAIHW